MTFIMSVTQEVSVSHCLLGSYNWIFSLKRSISVSKCDVRVMCVIFLHVNQVNIM